MCSMSGQTSERQGAVQGGETRGLMMSRVSPFRVFAGRMDGGGWAETPCSRVEGRETGVRDED